MSAGVEEPGRVCRVYSVAILARFDPSLASIGADKAQRTELRGFIYFGPLGLTIEVGNWYHRFFAQAGVSGVRTVAAYGSLGGGT